MGWLAGQLSPRPSGRSRRTRGGICARRFWYWRLGVPGDRSCEGRIFNLQAARFEFPCRTAIHPSNYGGTSKRGHADLISNPRRHRGLHTCQIPRDSSHPVDRPRSDGGTTNRSPPRYPSAASTTIHLAIESRGTHARFVHACTLEPPGRGIARG